MAVHIPPCRPLVLMLLALFGLACSDQTQHTASARDDIPPVISLIGPTDLYLVQFETYIEPGVTAYDNHDGQNLPHIDIAGQVNTSRPGTYLLRYRGYDSAGNASSTLARQVHVTPASSAPPSQVLPAYLAAHDVSVDLQLWRGPASLAQSGFSVDGEDATWHANGFHTGKHSALIHTSSPFGDTLTQTGFVWLKVERRALSIAEHANPAIFYGSSGSLDAENAHLSSARTLLYGDAGMGQDQSVLLYKSRHHRFSYISNGWRLVNEYLAYNDQVSAPQDKDFAEILLTWQGTRSQVYVDGLLIAENDNDTHIAQSWKRLYIGRRPHGDALEGVIHRVVMGSDFINLSARTSRKKIAVLGDSFAVAGSSRSTIANEDSASVGDIDALQTSLHSTPYARDVLRTSARGATGWIHQIQATLAQSTGTFQPVYNAACSGHGWVNAPYRDAAGEIPIAYLNAAIAYQPELVIVLASVNDLLPHIEVEHAAQSLRQDLDHLIDQLPHLEAVLLVQTFGWYQPDHLALQSENDHGKQWLKRYHNYNAALAEIDQYRGVVHWVTHDWGAQPPREYLIGSAPSNITTSRAIDYHPSPAGHVAMAEIIYTALLDWL